MMEPQGKSLSVISEPGFSIIVMHGIFLPLDSASISRIYESLTANGIAASFGHLVSLPHGDQSSLSLVVSDASLLAVKELLQPWVVSLSAQALTTRSGLTRLSIEDLQANNLITLANSVMNVLTKQGVELLSFTAAGRSILCLIDKKETGPVLEALSNMSDDWR